ncbi:inorganic diphosphatase [Candidatus Woesearchaeota archaeon]|nr:MAG: inorganic diphosphatase [Candidatus Woesearchaeota archaeon]
MAHPWHDVEPGSKVPELVNAVIEVPKDSKLKYELDKKSGLMKLDRALYSAVHYPGDYGFIPQTYWDDGDPLDIIIISNFPVYPGTIVQARPIGLIDMYDGKERDDKIIAVHATDPRFDRYTTVKDVPSHMLLEIKHFFETYKELQNKKVRVLSIKGLPQAKKCIVRGLKLYRQKFQKGK